MAILPGSGYLSNDLRTEGEMKVAMELLHDVIAELGSKAPTLLTISVDAITAPLASMILVQSEGHSEDAPDFLDSIARTNITQGRIVILKNNDGTSTENTATGQTITVKNGVGAGKITLRDGADSTFILCAQRMLALIYTGDHWVEVWRSYGRANSEDQLAERTNLGLGTASVEAIATGSGASANSTVLKVGSGANIATNALLAIDASGNIITGSADGGNADTLDSHDSAAFVRKDDSSVQNITGNLISKTSGATRIIVNTSDAGATTVGFSLQDRDIERAQLYIDTGQGDVYLSTHTGGTAKAAIRIDASSSKLEFNSDVGGGVATWESLRPGPGNGLNADQLDGEHLATIYSTLRNEIKAKVYMLLPDNSVPIFSNQSQLIIRMDVPEEVQALAGKYVKVDFRLFFRWTRSTRSHIWRWSLEDGIGVGQSGNGALNWVPALTTASVGPNTNNCRQGGFGYMTMPASFDSMVVTVAESSNTPDNPQLTLYKDATAITINSTSPASTIFPEFQPAGPGEPKFSWLSFQEFPDLSA